MQRDRARSRTRRHVDTLAELYPGGVTFYLTRFGESLDAPVERGLLLEADQPKFGRSLLLPLPARARKV